MGTQAQDVCLGDAILNPSLHGVAAELQLSRVPLNPIMRIKLVLSTVLKSFNPSHIPGNSGVKWLSLLLMQNLPASLPQIIGVE